MGDKLRRPKYLVLNATLTGIKQVLREIMKVHSLADMVFKLKANSSPENADLLLVAGLIIRYFNRPTHQITIEAIRGNRGYLMLYFSYLRMPLRTVDRFVALVGALVAEADVTVKENGSETERQPARRPWKNVLKWYSA